jgi:hypothetical protein
MARAHKGVKEYGSKKSQEFVPTRKLSETDMPINAFLRSDRFPGFSQRRPTHQLQGLPRLLLLNRLTNVFKPSLTHVNLSGVYL